MNNFDAFRPVTRRYFWDSYISCLTCIAAPIFSGSSFASGDTIDIGISAILRAAGPLLTATRGTCLGTAASFGILAGTTVTNTGPTVITGNLGLSPGSSVTGFPPGIVLGTQHVTDGEAAQAQLDLTAAYLDLEGRTEGVQVVAGNLGGQTLPPGLYKSASSLAVESGDLTLDARGDVNALWIFQIASTLTLTPGRKIILANGARAANVFWQVGSSATLETTSVFKGSILALTSISALTGSTVEGRLLARNGAVTLDTNAVTAPAPGIECGVLLTWNRVPNAFAHVLYRSTSASGPFSVVIAGLIATETIDNPPSSGTFHYRVSAIEPSFGETELSNVVSATV